MSFAIREFRASDAPAISELFHAAVHRLARADYTAEQLNAWSAEPRDPALVAKSAGDMRLTLVAADESDRPIACIDLEAGGISIISTAIPIMPGRR